MSSNISQQIEVVKKSILGMQAHLRWLEKHKRESEAASTTETVKWGHRLAEGQMKSSVNLVPRPLGATPPARPTPEEQYYGQSAEQDDYYGNSGC